MKKIIVAILVFLVAVLMAAPLAEATDSSIHNRGMVYVAPKGDIEVDGLIDSAWDAAEWTYINIPYKSAYTAETEKNYDYGGTECRAKVMWKEDTFFVLIQVNNEQDVFSEDIVEIYIEEGPKTQDGYSEFGYQIRYQYSNKKLSIVGGTNPTEFEYDEICPNYGITLENGDRTATMEFELRMLSPEGHKIGETVGLEFMFEDYRPFDNVRMTADVYRWNVIEVDGNGPTGVTRPFGESLNFGDLLLADENGNVPRFSGIEGGFPWLIILIIGISILGAAAVVTVTVIIIKKRGKARQAEEPSEQE